MTKAPKLEAKLRIGNEDLSSGSGGVYEHMHPVTGEFQASIPLAGKAEIDRAVEKAASVFEEWRRWKPEARCAVIAKFAKLIRENISTFAHLASIDNGSPIGGPTGGTTLLGEMTSDWHEYYAGWPDKLSGELLSNVLNRKTLTYTVPEPYGVVGIIITWNGPLISLGMKAAPALAAGNCVVVKPSEMTPFAPDFYARLAREAGFPDGVLSMLPGTVEAGEALVNHPKVEKISFTGGPIAARKILVACAEQMKPAVLELGGKSASVLFPDADLDMVAARAVFGSLGVMAGQGCAIPSRWIVHESIYDVFVDKMVQLTKHLTIGDPLDPKTAVGPLVNAAACDRVMGMIDRVREKKTGVIVTGGQRCGGDLAGKNYIQPTIIKDVIPGSEIEQIEVFGPVIIVQKFATEDDAVALANSTQYGLASYIHTKDLAVTLRLSERLKSGNVTVNGASPVAAFAPFGGLGVSGFGKEGGRAGIDEFLRYKTIAIAQ